MQRVFSETGDSHQKVKTLLLAVRRLEAAHSEVKEGPMVADLMGKIWRFDNYFEVFFWHRYDRN